MGLHSQTHRAHKQTTSLAEGMQSARIAVVSSSQRVIYYSQALPDADAGNAAHIQIAQEQ